MTIKYCHPERSEGSLNVMTRDRSYYVYIMTNRSGTLYTGVTSDLIRRMHEHKSRTHNGFSRKYKIDRLVYYEVFEDVHDALRAEKQIKG